MSQKGPITLFILLFSSLLLTSFSTKNKAPKYQMRTIVIDPGHGGHDTGCIGSSSHEKHVALSVSLKLGELIEKHFPDLRVIYTRKTDVFVELHERAAIANRNKADLFICIHCNSGPSAAFGAETFVMGLHKSADNLSVAKRENSSILLEKDYKTNYDGFDPNSPEANIIFSLYQNTFMNQSLHFASLLQENFSKNSGRFNRGVKQAGFLVLFRTAMPSVLIELGFLTNRADEKFLVSDKGQESMATSILAAFKTYKAETERKAGGGVIANEPETQPVKSTDKNALADATDKGITPVDNKDTAYKVPVEENISEASATPVASGNAAPGVPAGRIFYTIQVGAIPNMKAADEARYNKVPEIFKLISEDGITRFYSGNFANIDEARKSLMVLKQQGFKDAFISAFAGARRVTITEAAELLKRK